MKSIFFPNHKMQLGENIRQEIPEQIQGSAKYDQKNNQFKFKQAIIRHYYSPVSR